MPRKLTLSSEQIEGYNSRGYVAIEGVLTSEEIAEAHRVIDGFVEQSRRVTAHTDVLDLEPEHTPERPLIRRLKDPSRNHPFFDRLMRSDEILDLLVPLIGPDIRFLADKINMKLPEVGSPVEWHQDFAYGPRTNGDCPTVGFALDDSTVENGCLLVVPGSHLGPIFEHNQDGFFVGAINPNRTPVDLAQAVPIELSAGGISIHHTRLLHGSAPNRSARPRRLMLTTYAAADCWPLRGVSDLAAYNRDIVRGQPTNQVRLTTLTVTMAGPTVRSGSIYEIQSQLTEPAFARRGQG